MENTKLIISRRLIIRKFENSDLEKNLEFIKDPKFFYITKVNTKEELIEKTSKYYKEKDSIGVIQAFEKDDGVGIFIIINKSLRNRGYGREALEAVIDYFFTLGEKKEIYLKAEKNNQSFKSIIENLHFKKYDKDIKYSYYKMDNLDYMKYFAIFGEI